MRLFVDTSVWSLALRADTPPGHAHVSLLATQLESGGEIFTTGLVLQELLQGFTKPRSRALIAERFAVLPMLNPDRGDHVLAADLRTDCRRSGIQIGTIDALLAQLCLRYGLTMLTTDRDFANVANTSELTLWRPT